MLPLDKITEMLKNLPAAEREALRQLRNPSTLSPEQLKMLVEQVQIALKQNSTTKSNA